jgi:subtilisin family serine protease
VIRRPFPVALCAALVALATSPAGAGAASVSCTDKPSSPVGYELESTHADEVAIPPAAPAIAVLDTGIANVPELSGRVRPGYNVSNGGPATNDIDGHGTSVASIAAAAAGGVRGVSPTSPVIPIKIFDDAGNSGVDDFIAGIERAISLNAGVINVSAAGDPAIDAATKREAQDAINAAVSLGIPVVAASGNEGDPKLDVPASLAHVIAVGATTRAGVKAPFSNGGTGLDLAAPGDGIVTAAPSFLCSAGYSTATGTSFAAPLVAGAAALLLQRDPDLDVSQITDMLRLRGVRSPAPAWSDEIGFGLLNVAEALNGPVPSADLPEVNDDIKWAKLQPAVLTPTMRSKTIYPRIAPHQDPSDVYRVKLKKGDVLNIRLQQPSGTKLRLSYGGGKLASKRGTTFRQKIKKTGTYFVGVTIAKSPPSGTGYALTFRR